MQAIDKVDLGALAAQLAARFASGLPRGHVRARTAFRDAVVETLACSQVDAEQLVDTMVARGFLRPSQDPGAAAAAAEIAWTIDPTAGAETAQR